MKFLSPRTLALLAACAALMVYPTVASVLYASGEGLQGTELRRAAGGASWTRVNGGLPRQAALAVAVDPARPNTLVASAGPGIFRSPNRGARG